MSAPDSLTIDYYDRHAASFVHGTVNARMDEALAQFVELLPAGARVLDWGCGSGRDSRALRAQGYSVTSVDGSNAMADEALAATGTVVRVESFDELAEVGCFEGIWACASLLHVRPEDLPALIGRAATALVPQGVLYCSFKYGRFAGHRDGRWFTHLDEASLAQLLEPHFELVRLWQTADVRPERSDERWISALARKRP